MGIKKTLTLTAIGIALVAMTGPRANAGTFGIFVHRHHLFGCHKAYTLRVKQYNAFTPFCSGCVTCTGGCPPMMHHGGHPGMPYPDMGCPDGFCGAGPIMGAPIDVADSQPAAEQKKSLPEPSSQAQPPAVAAKPTQLPTGPVMYHNSYYPTAYGRYPAQQQPTGYYPYPQYPQYPQYGYGYQQPAMAAPGMVNPMQGYGYPMQGYYGNMGR